MAVRVTIKIEAGARVDVLRVADQEVPITYSDFSFDAPDGFNDEEILEFAKKMVQKLYDESGMLISGPVFVEGRKEPIGWV